MPPIWAGRRSVFDIGGDDLVACQHQLHACTHRGCLRGHVPPPKLENLVFLQLESCNLVNTFRRKFRAGDGYKKKKKKQFFGPE